MSTQQHRQLFRLAHAALCAESADHKATLIAQLQVLARQLSAINVVVGTDLDELPPLDQPGYPTSLQLVHPKQLKQRKLGSVQGRATLLHAIAHIEFNAINLALDAVWRFRAMPLDYYHDWLSVAADEARHHALIVARLNQLGYDYGDFPVHNGLWDIAWRTRHDLLSRMAMVPCVFEARGLDVTPGMIIRLRAVGDNDSADMLQLIVDEEVEHVSIGIRWYHRLCEQQSLAPVEHFSQLLDTYMPNRPMGPFNQALRLSAGFSEQWMERLCQQNAERATAQGSTNL